MHSITPPFVPRVKGWDDTKYFDEEGSVSDIGSVSSEDAVACNDENRPSAPTSQHQPENQNIVPEPPKDERHVLGSMLNVGAPQDVKEKKAKDKKRPRDKILRDLRHGPLALKMRREGAFLGYNYRKPKDVDEVIREALGELGEAIS